MKQRKLQKSTGLSDYMHSQFEKRDQRKKFIQTCGKICGDRAVLYSSETNMINLISVHEFVITQQVKLDPFFKLATIDFLVSQPLKQFWSSPNQANSFFKPQEVLIQNNQIEHIILVSLGTSQKDDDLMLTINLSKNVHGHKTPIFRQITPSFTKLTCLKRFHEA